MLGDIVTYIGPKVDTLSVLWMDTNGEYCINETMHSVLSTFYTTTDSWNIGLF